MARVNAGEVSEPPDPPRPWARRRSRNFMGRTRQSSRRHDRAAGYFPITIDAAAPEGRLAAVRHDHGSDVPLFGMYDP
jgi:hypothetical protein